MPDFARYLIAGLKIDNTTPGAIGELLVRTEARTGSGVELVGFRQRQARSVDAFVEDVLNQHPELGAPIANMVLRNYVVANAGDDASQAVTDHRRAQVPDMHLFRHVGSRVVDHHNLRVGNL